jgi:hypothetical protein
MFGVSGPGLLPERSFFPSHSVLITIIAHIFSLSHEIGIATRAEINAILASKLDSLRENFDLPEWHQSRVLLNFCQLVASRIWAQHY